jgi:hypothetical protein
MARPPAAPRTSFLSGIAAGLAVSATCACSGGAYSFEPSIDVVPSTNANMAADVGATPIDVATSRSVIDAAPGNTVVDVRVGPLRDTGAADTTSRTIESAAPDAMPPIPSTGLLMWLSADVDVSREGGHVAIWRDRSGNGNDARQADVNLRPALDPSWHDGRPAVQFDGVSTFLELPSSFNDFSAGLGVFVVGDWASTTACPSFVHFSNGGEINDLSLHIETGNTFVYEVADQATQSIVDVAPAHRPLMLGAVQRPNQEVRLFSGGAASGQSTEMLPAQVHRAMNHIGRSSYFDCGLLDGHIAEIILYRRALDNGERVAIEEYLRAKWNL